MKKLFSVCLVASMLFLLGCESESAYQKGLASAKEAGKIHWVTIEEAEELSKVEGKKIMVDAYTSWCGWCKKMDAATFAHPDIVNYVNDNFYAVKFDAEVKDTISFKGKDYKFVAGGRRGYNELTNLLLKGRRSYPTISFLDEEANMIDAFPGFKQAPQFDGLLKFVAEDHYKSTAFTEFSRDFKSAIPTK